MDKHLKELNLEDKINITFTEGNKMNVLNKISKIDEKKQNKKKQFFQKGLALTFASCLVAFAFAFVLYSQEDRNDSLENAQGIENEKMMNQNGDEPSLVLEEDKEEENDNKNELKVGADYEFWNPETGKKWDSKTKTYIHYDYSDPNYNLYVAHLRAALITDNAFYMGHRMMDNDSFTRYLDSILFYLNKIKPTEEKMIEFQAVVDLAEQAINENVEKGDPILDELHSKLHDLDEYYNVKPFLDDITSQDGVLFETKE